MNNFQITLDGFQEEHNKVRFCENKEGSFNKIVENINFLSEKNDMHICVRINYTEKTLPNVTKIIDCFSETAKTKILFLFQQVWQDSSKRNISSEEYQKEFERRGLKVRTYETNHKCYVCYADRMEQAIINYDGKVYKCTARDFNNEKAVGKLLQNGEIEWDTYAISKRFATATYNNRFCLNCNLLPACMGPCSQKVFEFPDNISEETFRKYCLKDGVEEILENEINKYYLTIKNASNV